MNIIRLDPKIKATTQVSVEEYVSEELFCTATNIDGAYPQTLMSGANSGVLLNLPVTK